MRSIRDGSWITSQNIRERLMRDVMDQLRNAGVEVDDSAPFSARDSKACRSTRSVPCMSSKAASRDRLISASARPCNWTGNYLPGTAINHF
jgi:hypothetical protein